MHYISTTLGLGFMMLRLIQLGIKAGVLNLVLIAYRFNFEMICQVLRVKSLLADPARDIETSSLHSNVHLIEESSTHISQLWMTAIQVSLQETWLHGTRSQYLAADYTLWQFQPILDDVCESEFDVTFLIVTFFRRRGHHQTCKNKGGSMRIEKCLEAIFNYIANSSSPISQP